MTKEIENINHLHTQKNLKGEDYGKKNSNNNKSKRIAKNTFFLYIRMVVLMFLSLFTARILLDKLGIEDYGIYNVVGGLAGMFTFFSSSLTNASQRFLNIEIGMGSVENAAKIVRQNLTLYLVICAVVVVLAETVGLWFVCNKLVIRPERMTAALWIYQFLIISLCVTLIGIIFNSEIIAHEDMNVYSYIGIYEGVSKLLICYFISVCSFDRLILYGLLLLLVSLSVQFFYVLYCVRNYVETQFRLLWDESLLKNMLSLIGWNTAGTFVYAVNDTGINILLNLFFGPAVNAARAISYQVSMALNNFSTNFFTAVRPQLTKSYAAHDWNYLFRLFYGSSKFSFYLLWVFSLPISFSINEILSAWLVSVPEYTGIFTILILAYSLVNVLNNPIWALALAVGKLERYIGIGSTVFLMMFPLAYVALKCGCSPTSVFIIMVTVRSIYLVVVLKIIHRYVAYSYKDYLGLVVLPIITVALLTSLVAYGLRIIVPGGLFMTILYCICVFFVSCLVIWLLGITNKERNFIINILKNKIK